MKRIANTVCLFLLPVVLQMASITQASDVASADAETTFFSHSELLAASSFEETSASLNPSDVFRNTSTWVYDANDDAGHHHGSRRKGLADKHSPASLMGDHIHGQGEWMAEYKYMNMYMEDNRVGTRSVSDADSVTIGGTFTNVHPMGTNRGASPTQMTMEMHMVHLMYGLTDDITLYTMLNFPALTMDHIRGPGNMTGGGPGTSFTTHNSGFGDTGIGALIRLSDSADEDDDVILNLGGTLPTGDIFTTTSRPTAGMMAQPLPFPMRLGSGTFNARPGVTWKHYFESGSLGVQFQTDIPLGRNYRGYSVSDTFELHTWYAHLLTDRLACSIRVENEWKSNYDGSDPQTPNQIISTNVESFRGGYTLNLGIGVMALVGESSLLNVEIVPTVHQDLDGIQLETDWSLVASWSKTF